MEYRIISLPPFKAAGSGVDSSFDFSPEGVLGRFDAYFSAIKPSARDGFMPRDFLYFDDKRGGMVWMWALADGMDDGGNEIIDFDGGLYVTYAYKDGDDNANGELYAGAMKYIEDLQVFETDIRENHYAMGHIITPAEVISAMGWAQMETFIPIKLKKQS